MDFVLSINLVLKFQYRSSSLAGSVVLAKAREKIVNYMTYKMFNFSCEFVYEDFWDVAFSERQLVYENY